MDNDNFEKQFKQSVKTNVTQPMADNSVKKNSKLAIVIAAILAVVVLIEAVIIAVVTINYFEVIKGIDVETEEVYDESDNSEYIEETEETEDTDTELPENSDNTQGEGIETDEE